MSIARPADAKSGIWNARAARGPEALGIVVPDVDQYGLLGRRRSESVSVMRSRASTTGIVSATDDGRSVARLMGEFFRRPTATRPISISAP